MRFPAAPAALPSRSNLRSPSPTLPATHSSGARPQLQRGRLLHGLQGGVLQGIDHGLIQVIEVWVCQSLLGLRSVFSRQCGMPFPAGSRELQRRDPGGPGLLPKAQAQPAAVPAAHRAAGGG